MGTRLKVIDSSVTSPDPSGLGEDQYGTSRKFIRIALIIGAFNQLVDLVSRSGAASLQVGYVFRGLSVALGLVAAAGRSPHTLARMPVLGQRRDNDVRRRPRRR